MSPHSNVKRHTETTRPPSWAASLPQQPIMTSDTLYDKTISLSIISFAANFISSLIQKLFLQTSSSLSFQEKWHEISSSSRILLTTKIFGRDAWFGDAQLAVVHAAAARDRNDNEENRNEIGTMKKKMNDRSWRSF
ncbi:hypothetical protein P8452_25626 [Trifolium repens]|nr:hypothetical protein P8452_25626 [Trifolium repens]